MSGNIPVEKFSEGMRNAVSLSHLVTVLIDMREDDARVFLQGTTLHGFNRLHEYLTSVFEYMRSLCKPPVLSSEARDEIISLLSQCIVKTQFFAEKGEVGSRLFLVFRSL